MKIKLMEKRGYFEQDCTKLTSEYVVYLMKWNMQILMWKDMIMQ